MVSKTEACWLWMGGLRKGYARFWVDGKSVVASRFIYESLHGTLPPEIQVCHSCDNPRCVRPKHLFAGTQSDNIQDSVAKGRFLVGQRSRSKSTYTHGERCGGAKLTEAQVREIKLLYDGNARRRDNLLSLRSLAKRYNVSKFAIQAIVRGQTWCHLDSVIV